MFIGITGTHEHNKTTDDVTKLRVNEQSLKFLPTNIGQFLPNTATIEITASKLTKVPKMRHLKWIEITSNDIPTVDDDTFGESPDIEFIQLANNGIASIGENLFANLKRLRHLDMSNNQLTTLSKHAIPADNVLREILLRNNRLARIDSEIVKTLTKAHVIELSGNPCVDNKFYRAADHEKKIMEIYGEIEFQCKRAE
jgi:Leucine-rich repeat (LRR) protein